MYKEFRVQSLTANQLHKRKSFSHCIRKTSRMKHAVQSCFPKKNGLTNTTNINNKTTASMLNHKKHQIKTLVQDLYISFHTKSWYGLELLLMELHVL